MSDTAKIVDLLIHRAVEAEIDSQRLLDEGEQRLADYHMGKSVGYRRAADAVQFHHLGEEV